MGEPICQTVPGESCPSSTRTVILDAFCPCGLCTPLAESRVCAVGGVWVVLLLLSPYHGVLAVVEIRAQNHIVVSREGAVSLAGACCDRGFLLRL